MIKRISVTYANELLKKINHVHKAFLSNKQTMVQVDDKDYDKVINYMKTHGISLLIDDPVHLPNIYSCYKTKSL
jgi:hypothetical protein